MELAKYKACICEGSAEEAIIDILVDNDLLIFNRCFCIVGLRVNQKEIRAGMVKNPCPFYIHSTSLKKVVYAMIIKVTTRNV